MGGIRTRDDYDYYDDASLNGSEDDNIASPTIPTDEHPSEVLEVQIVTEEEIHSQVQRELMQQLVVDACDVRPFKKRNNEARLAKTTTNVQRRRVGILTAAVLFVAAIVVSLVVGLKSKRHNSNGVKPSQAPTHVPTAAPTLTLAQARKMRFEAFRSLLLNHSVSSKAKLFSTTSPQYHALEWIAVTDKANLNPESTPFQFIKERYVLATLYFATNGPNWNSTALELIGNNFFSAESVCNWGLVKCGPDGNNLTQELTLRTYIIIIIISLYHDLSLLLF